LGLAKLSDEFQLSMVKLDDIAKKVDKEKSEEDTSYN